MRLARWFVVGIFVLATSRSAHAQSANVPNFQPAGFSSALTGIRPTDVQFRQIDTKALLRAPVPAAMNTSQRKGGIGGFFRNVFGFMSKPIRGNSPLPDPSTVPGWQFPNSPIKPMAPIIPGPIVQ